MMSNPMVFVALILISGSGFALGGYYYLRPEKVVFRRIKEEHKQTARKDPEFRQWLDTEVESQIGRARRLGLTIIIFEAILMVVIIGMFQKSFMQ